MDFGDMGGKCVAPSPAASAVAISEPNDWTVVTEEDYTGAPEAASPDHMGLSSATYRGDYGDVDEHDRRENELILQKGFRLLSAYALSSGVKTWSPQEENDELHLLFCGVDRF